MKLPTPSNSQAIDRFFDGLHLNTAAGTCIIEPSTEQSKLHVLERELIMSVVFQILLPHVFSKQCKFGMANYIFYSTTVDETTSIGGGEGLARCWLRILGEKKKAKKKEG